MKVFSLLISCFFLSFSLPIGNNNPNSRKAAKPMRLIVLDPAHQHGASMQNQLKGLINPLVHVYAPLGPDLEDTYLGQIKKYNASKSTAQPWELKIYTGNDYLEKMLKEKAGDVVLLAGNNQKKIDYIKRSIDAGLNVISDKPMTITPEGFEILKESFSEAEKKNLFISDLQSMTMRNQITFILQREFSKLPEVFGKLQRGSLENPAVFHQSTHAYYKHIIRPAWFFDVNQQGYALADIATHLVDIIQWGCFPEKTIDYKKDIRMLSARQWPTKITPAQFKLVTNQEAFPGYLENAVKDSILNVYGNGEMNYTLKDVHARVSIIWDFEAPEGGGDMQSSIMRGTRANLVIRQGKDQRYKSTLYIEPVANDKTDDYEKVLKANLIEVKKKYPNIELIKNDKGWEVVPNSTSVENKRTLGKVPAWELANMLAKYYTTTQGVALALKSKHP